MKPNHVNVSQGPETTTIHKSSLKPEGNVSERPETTTIHKGTLKPNDGNVSEAKSSFFNSKIRVYLHDEGQLIQNFNNENAEYDVKILSFNNKNNLLSVRLQELTRLYKRADANDPCDQSIDDDDDKYLEFVTNHVGCIPPYWKSIVKMKAGEVLPNCTSKEDLKNIYDHNEDRKKTSAKYMPSCKRTTVLAMAESTAFQLHDFWVLRVFYQPKIFTEITNTKAVGFESFWGGVGGFVGIFLGVSLMQLPELISFKKIRNYVNKLSGN